MRSQKNRFADDRFLLRFVLIIEELKKRKTMNKNNYIPQPIDTTGVALPKELNDLAEEIAKNVHEVWSEGRMKEGWTYGEERDDAKKHHPCLVPYEDLTETEKEYDRNTSQETLKLIMKLGFKIVKE